MNIYLYFILNILSIKKSKIILYKSNKKFLIKKIKNSIISSFCINNIFIKFTQKKLETKQRIFL